MQYRRARVDGGASIFTVNLAERHQSLLVEYIDVLRKVVGMVKERHPFTINAMVILPEHLHAVWTLPPGDADYPGRWMLIKTGFSRHIPQGERKPGWGEERTPTLCHESGGMQCNTDAQGLMAARLFLPSTLQNGTSPCW